MSRIAYYLFIKPLSLLPIGVLYLLSNFLFFVLYRLAGYRKKVVFTNLKNSFPNHSESEINAIAKKFYKHFCDLIIESVKLFSMSKEGMVSRAKIVNPEVVDQFVDANRSVIIIGAHYCNWEVIATSSDAQLRHQVIGIFSPLKDKFLNKKLKASRSKYGLQLISTKQTRTSMNSEGTNAYVFISDQSPSNAKKAYWTHFLNQDTAVLFGAEKYAKLYNYPVVYGEVTRIKRGHCEIFFHVLTDDPVNTEHGYITEKHTRLLEGYINKEPAYWLWTHRRWKRKKPKGVKIKTQGIKNE